MRSEYYKVVEVETPEISKEQARLLLGSIDALTSLGLQDRALLAILIYIAARDGSVARLGSV